MTDVFAIRGLKKSFGRVNVLLGFDLDMRPGEVVVLMGANGAGKSTLVKIMCGSFRADAGQMTLNGKPYAPPNAAAALSHGVVTVHQSIDDGVIPDLDVATNLMLSRLTEPGARLMLRDKVLRKEAQAVAASMGLNVDVRQRVSDLGVADRQMIAIARAMAYSPKVLILDEPTSSLSAVEADRLFALIDRLRAQGVAILYISHRMSDIRRIADRIICMRDGAISGVFDKAPLDYDGAVSAMLGRKITQVDFEPQSGMAPVLELQNMTLRANSRPFDLAFADGEIVAITGLLGSGKSEFADIVFGLGKPRSGQMLLSGKPYQPRSPVQAIAAGVFMSSKDRASNAVIPAFDIDNNMTLPFFVKFSRLSLLSKKLQKRATENIIKQLGIVCRSGKDAIGTLSGGNQQKVMIGRWLLADCKVLLLDEPFQGVDIGARRDIGRHIRKTAIKRATLIFVSELDEALEIADRIIVLHEGSVVGEHLNAKVDMNSLVAQVSGTPREISMANL